MIKRERERERNFPPESGGEARIAGVVPERKPCRLAVLEPPAFS
jgi:hypothetical protein